MKVYFIPGIANNRLLYTHQENLFDDVEFLEWFKPFPNERLHEYAERFSKAINTAEPFALIGTSFGGVMAVELCKFLHPEAVIIISSVKSKNELPFYIRLGRWFPFYQLSAARIYHKITGYYWNKQADLKPADSVFKEMAEDADPDFIKWGIKQLMRWNNTKFWHKIVHIQGDKDYLFPLRKVKDAIVIKNGSHAMIYEKPNEINPILKEIITQAAS